MQNKILFLMFSCAVLNTFTVHSMDAPNEVSDHAPVSLVSSTNKTAEIILDTTITLVKAKVDFENAESVKEKVDVVIILADQLSPDVMDKVDNIIDKASDVKDVQKASEALDIISEVAAQLGDKNDNATLEHLGSVVGNTSDLLKANNTKDVAKEVIEIVDDVNGLVKENKGFFKRMFSCCGPKKKK